MINELKKIKDSELLKDIKAEEMLSMSQRTTREKLIIFLNMESIKNNSKEFTISFDRQALADYLGVERSAMSAELSKLRSEGILESEKNKFKLL